MKVVHYFPVIDFREGGVARSIVDMAITLQGNNIECVVCAVQLSREVQTQLEQGGVEVVLLPRKATWLGRYSGESLRILRTIVESSDVVHLHTPWQLTNIQVSAVCRKARVPYILSSHGMFDTWSMGNKKLKKLLFIKLLEITLFRHIFAFHCTAAGERTQSQRVCQKAIWEVVPLVIELEPYMSLPAPREAIDRFSIDTSKIQMLFLSRIHPKKGIELLLHSCAMIQEMGVEFGLTIAGPADEGYARDLKSLAQKLGVQESVQFVGEVSGSLKLSLYQAANMLVIPTHQENFGLVFPESLLCQTPVVTTFGVDIWPELEESGAVAIVDRDATAITNAIMSTYQSKSFDDDVRMQGRQYVLRWLSPQKIAEQYGRLYARAMDAGESDST